MEIWDSCSLLPHLYRFESSWAPCLISSTLCKFLSPRYISGYVMNFPCRFPRGRLALLYGHGLGSPIFTCSCSVCLPFFPSPSANHPNSMLFEPHCSLLSCKSASLSSVVVLVAFPKTSNSRSILRGQEHRLWIQIPIHSYKRCVLKQVIEPLSAL